MCWLDWIFLAVKGIASRRSLHSLGRDDSDVISSVARRAKSRNLPSVTANAALNMGICHFGFIFTISFQII